MVVYQQKITFGEMRASGIRDVLTTAITSKPAQTAGPMTCGSSLARRSPCAGVVQWFRTAGE